MTKFTSVDFDIASIELENLLEYWKELKQGQALPFRQQFDPVAVPQCLKYIVLLDVEEVSPRYCIRLAGSAVNPAHLKPITGRYIEEIFSKKDLDVILPQYEHSVQYGVPTFMHGSAEMLSHVFLKYERLILPMTSNGIRTDKLVVGIKFKDIKQGILDRPVYKT